MVSATERAAADAAVCNLGELLNEAEKIASQRMCGRALCNTGEKNKSMIDSLRGNVLIDDAAVRRCDLIERCRRMALSSADYTAVCCAIYPGFSPAQALRMCRDGDRRLSSLEERLTRRERALRILELDPTNIQGALDAQYPGQPSNRISYYTRPHIHCGAHCSHSGYSEDRRSEGTILC
jgi:hypothetical protein